jgi:hypothetical protein
MEPTENFGPNDIAFHDPERKGIYIHKNQLKKSQFKVGDRFSLRKGKNQLFAITIIKDIAGNIFFDKNGIFIERSRKIDMLLGGIFEKYAIYLESDIPDSIKLRPLDIVQDAESQWT